MSAPSWPIGVRIVDVREPLRPMRNVSRYARVRVFVADGPELVGSVDVWNRRHSISAMRLRDAVTDALGYTLAKRAFARGLACETAEPPALLSTTVSVSVIVPTCDRPEDLRRCLASLFTQEVRRPLEIIVVDNRPGRGAAREVVREFPRAVVVEEHRPGLSYARNAGFAAACGDILVTTDDDVVAPPDWIEKLVAPFARREVTAVTGHVLPLALETEAQCRFEAYGGLGKGFERFEVDGAWFRVLRTAVPTWRIGATANAAFRADALANPQVGTMNEALGAGTPTGCSEDTYLFYKLLKAGHTIVYEPSAYVWHRHRRTNEALRKQIYAYSKGHIAYHLLTLLNDGDKRALVRFGWSLPKTYLRRAFERLRRRSDYPMSLIALEIAGNVMGPFALWRAQYRSRLMGPSVPFMRGRRTVVPPAARAAEPELPTPSESADAVSLESPLAENPSR